MIKTFKEYIVLLENKQWYVALWDDGTVIAGPFDLDDAKAERERLTRNDQHGRRYVLTGEPPPADSNYPHGRNTVAWRNPDSKHPRPWKLTNPITGEFDQLK